MPFPKPKKKPGGDFALLLGEPEEKPGDALDDVEPDEDGDDFGDMDELGDELPEDDALSDEPNIDPEQAALAQTLGFSEPEQQQALIDLIKLVTSAPDSMGSEDADFPPLPESTY